MHSNKLTSGLGAGESRARTGSPLAVALLSQKSRAGSQSSSESTLPSPRPTLTRIEHMCSQRVETCVAPSPHPTLTRIWVDKQRSDNAGRHLPNKQPKVTHDIVGIFVWVGYGEGRRRLGLGWV